MSDEKKRLADALAALSSGQHHEPEHTEAAEPVAETDQPTADADAAPTSSARPAAPVSNRPASPREAAPVAKVPPRARPSSPTPPTERPLEPASTRPPEPVGRSAAPSRPASPVSDHDEFAAPAGDTPVPRRRVVRESKTIFASLAFKRALIPVCLVLGVGMPLLAVLWFTLDEDHPARKVGVLFPMVFLVVGLGVLTLGILIMLLVRNELQVRRAVSGSV